jgi:hypothetical protein
LPQSHVLERKNFSARYWSQKIQPTATVLFPTAKIVI